MTLLKRVILILIVMTLLSGTVIATEAPYRSYTYDRFGNSVPSPSGYLPQRQLFGTDFGVGNLTNPNDLFYEKTRNELYIVDTGNQRIIVTDKDYNLIRVITEFSGNQGAVSMNNPMGVFVKENGDIYVADQGNARIIVSDSSLNIIDIFGKPVSELITGDFEYRPSKVVVDRYNRIYVQATGVFEGIISLNEEGSFLNYYGSNRVEMTAARLVQQFWRRFMTREQAGATENFIPIEYSNVFLDDEGFIFATATTSTTYDNQIVRLNPMGNDILRWRRLKWFENSNFADVFTDEHGFVTAVDSVRGRIYQAEPDRGTMMFAFGGIGNMLGTFTRPVSIVGIDDRLLVLDRDKNAITVFTLTTFGRAVRQAQVLYLEGLYEESIEPWYEVIRRNSNYLFAYGGLGKAYYQMEEYETAMHYFKLGYNKPDYSDALREHSILLMRENFGFIFIGLVVAGGLIIFFRIRSKKRKKEKVFGGGNK